MGKKRILIVEDDKDQQKWLYEKLSSVYDCVPLKDTVAFETLQRSNKNNIWDVVSGILCEQISKPDLMIFDVCLTSIEYDNLGLDILRKVRMNFSEHTYTPVIILTRKSIEEVKVVLDNSNTSIESYPKGMMSTFYLHKPDNDLTKYDQCNPEWEIFLESFPKIVEMLLSWCEISPPELTFQQFLSFSESYVSLKSVYTEKLRPVHNIISYLFEAINADSVSLVDLSKKLFRIFSQEVIKLNEPDEEKIYENVYASLVAKLYDSLIEDTEVIQNEKKIFIDAIKKTFDQKSIEPFGNKLLDYSFTSKDVMEIQKQLLLSLIDCLLL